MAHQVRVKGARQDGTSCGGDGDKMAHLVSVKEARSDLLCT